ncbi:uncharacterized protein P884DRAFT_278076 [Thermothelomyces heterothallicus CBS 202.75]|uniref:uncharacterized protein n=1 Tax=Thermothelomyces heterothallicus CBS 202.75 TaxID=1149848 RepID=UPI0037444A8B
MDERLQGSYGYLKHGGERSRWLRGRSRQEGRVLLAALLEEDNGSVPSPLKFLALAAIGVSCSPAQYLHVNTMKGARRAAVLQGRGTPSAEHQHWRVPTDPRYGGRPGRGREVNAPSVNRPDSQMPHRIIPWHRVHIIGRAPGGGGGGSRGVWNRPTPIPHRSMTSGQTRSAQIRSPAAGVGA